VVIFPLISNVTPFRYLVAPGPENPFIMTDKKNTTSHAYGHVVKSNDKPSISPLFRGISRGTSIGGARNVGEFRHRLGTGTNMQLFIDPPYVGINRGSTDLE
jgi:hypothetical protein